jgi:cytoskeletal protein RodZ
MSAHCVIFCQEEKVESLGEKLRAAREGKSIDFDQAGRDTKIAVRYLQALENEDFSGFSGEAYITGFLRNYSSYLELDTQELLSLYRAFKIQEQPVPVEQLLKHPSSLPKILIIAASIILVLGAAGGGGYLLATRPLNPKPVAPVPRTPVEYAMNGDSFEHRFFKGDTILVPSGDGQDSDRLKLELLSLGEAVTISTPGGQVILDLSEGANLNFDNNPALSLQINAVDYSKNNADMGVLLRFELKDTSSPAAGSSTGETAEIASITGQTTSTVIFNSSTPYPFTLQSVFQGYCMFRWEILMERDRRDRNERYFQRSDEINIQAQNGIRIWASNAQAAKFQVIGGGRTVPVEIGSAGEVVVADIRWVRDDDSRYRLIVARLESGST